MKLWTIALLLAAAAGCGHEDRSGEQDAAPSSAAAQPATAPPTVPEPLSGTDSFVQAPAPPPGQPAHDGSQPPPPPKEKPRPRPKPEIVDFRK